MATIRNYRDLDVYQNSMQLVMKVFALSRRFPREEQYSLTDQFRRCTRSVCANLAEAWRKRRYAAAFVAKLNDAGAEAAESSVHAEIAWRAGYVSEETFRELDDASDKIIGQIVRIADHPEKWVIGSKRNS